MRYFVFRITEICNKKCLTCCCNGSNSRILDPDLFRDKLLDIRRFSAARKERPLIFMTGGEPFLYRAIDNNKSIYNIVRLLALVRIHIPEAMVVIKTSGWLPHTVLDRFLGEVNSSCKEMKIEVRLGFNLYQSNSMDGQERLYHMVESILSFQQVIRIETIYDKINLSSTADTLQRTLARFHTPESGAFRDMISRPELGHQLIVPIRWYKGGSGSSWQDKSVVITMMPAHPGHGMATPDEFFDTKIDQICPLITKGPDHIMYNPDLSFYHCNDAHVDYSIPPFPARRWNSTEDQFVLLNSRFECLRKKLMTDHVGFREKRTQCEYCTKFIRSFAPSQEGSVTRPVV